jgi:F-type H+-transporting ATPase subunit b
LEALGKLGINLGYLVTQIVNFLVLFLLLRAVAYKPLMNMLQQRRERIEQGLEEARKAREALESAKADAQHLLDEKQAEAQRLAGQTVSKAEEAAKQIREEAREQAARVFEQAKAEAEAERNRVLGDLREQIVDLSISAARRLIGDGLDPARQRELVREFFTHMPEEAHGLGEHVTVITALPLTDEERAQAGRDLGTGQVEFRVDPAILGGVIVRSGAREVDGSLAGQLTGMRAGLR